MKSVEYLRLLLSDPKCVVDWGLADWNMLIQQGYAIGMLAKVNDVLRSNQYFESVPKQVKWHFEAANAAFAGHVDAVNKECNHVITALSTVGIIPTFLKGAAYVLAEDNSCRGRIFNDIDVFIPKIQLAMAEKVLGWQGWVHADKDDYDESYYRKWMHEIPPLTHESRGTTLDVHHNLLPIIGRVKLDVSKLSDNLCNIAGKKCTVLCPEDRVLHSAAHLFLNGEFNNGFRDLYDLDQLIRQHINEQSDFLLSLVQRSEKLVLQGVLYYCFRYSKYMFNTPIPESLSSINSTCMPSIVKCKLMDALFLRALRPHHSSCSDGITFLSLHFLFIRGHWLKMPLPILLYHCVIKFLKVVRKMMNGKKVDRS